MRMKGKVLHNALDVKGKVSYNALDVKAGVLLIKISLKQSLAQYGLQVPCKSDNNSLKSLLTKNLSRETVSKSVTLTRSEWQWHLTSKLNLTFMILTQELTR